MHRKTFLKSAFGAGLMAALPSKAAGSILTEKLSLIKPLKLNNGDTIGLISPAGVLEEKEMRESVDNLTKLGFHVIEGKNALKRHGYFAGTDRERADDLMDMFANPKVKAVVCTRGGYGVARIFPYLDFAFIRNHPKILIGYSDITALHIALYKEAGLVSFHGPVGTSTYNQYSVENFKKSLMQTENLPLFNKCADDGDKPESRAMPLRSGKASGWLAGGNLSIVASLVGTSYDVNYDGALMYLEEVGEEPYRVDRMLTQMLQAGKFKGVTGVILGIFKNCSSKEKDSGITNSFSLYEVLYDRLYDLNIPVLYGMSFGHVENKIVLPFGIKAEMDTSAVTLRYLEHAVI